ncbi:MAG: thiamine pyrophosphate-binding protein [Rhodospirillales bacterium]|nr:thiamine pyrophosphate-binding protein [Rhodospirillales bacterium]
MNGGEALVQTLASHAVDTVFCVPGESYLAVLDGLRRHASSIRLVTNRHESGATFAANGYAKIARRPGIAFVSRGPGATNASIGVHTADQDSIPLVLFIGQVPREELGREAFQEIDYKAFFGTIAKAVLEPIDPADVARATADALTIAQAGRPGPVVVVLPEDVTEAEAGDVAIPTPLPPVRGNAGDRQIREAAALIDNAKRVLIIAGELIKSEAATMRLGAFAESAAAAVVSAFRCQDALNNDHPAYAGLFGLGRPPYLQEAWAEADLVILAGSRFDAITSVDFTLRDDPKAMIVIHPDPRTVAGLRPTLGIASGVGPVLRALTTAIETPSAERAAWQARLRAGFERYQAQAPDAVGAVDMTAVIRHVDSRLAEIDHVVTNDAGNFSTWLHRHFRYRLPDSQAGPMAGAMGYAVPSAVGAALAREGAHVVSFVGDGGFMMTGQELSTAVQNGLKVTVVVCDNSHYGTIMMHQHRYAGAGNYAAIALNSPDFAALGAAYGAKSWTVTTTDGFGPAFDEALAHDGPGLIHVVTDIRDISASSPLNSQVPNSP